MLISKMKFYHCFILLIFISVVLAFSSCRYDGNETSQSSQDPVTASPLPEIEIITSATPSRDDTDSAYIVQAEKVNSSHPYIKVYNPYGEVTYIQLDEKTAVDLNNDLGAMKETEILQYIGTEKEFFPENIYLYIGNKLVAERGYFGSGYAILQNSEGKLSLKDTDTGMFYDADDVCSKLIAISRNLGVTSDITNDEIASVIKAELKVNDVKQIEITDKEALDKLESMFRNSVRMVNPSTYNIAAVLVLAKADGECIEIELDDVSDHCIIGHSYWYDYGPGTDGDNSRNNLKELFTLLGITDWS